MRSFVTGASGFVGSHLVEHLREHDHMILAARLYEHESRKAGTTVPGHTP